MGIKTPDPYVIQNLIWIVIVFMTTSLNDPSHFINEKDHHILNTQDF